jgi:hypothetical protein
VLGEHVAADQHGRHARRAQRLVVEADTRPRSEEHHDVAEAEPLLVVQAAHDRGRLDRLLVARRSLAGVLDDHELHRGIRRRRRRDRHPQRRELAQDALEPAVQRIEHRRLAAVVLAQRERGRPHLRPPEALHVRPAEPVDRLLLVAHPQHPAGTVREEFDQLVLQWVDVLGLVDVHPVEPVCGPRRRIRLQHMAREQLQILKVDRATLLLQALVRLAHAGDERGEGLQVGMDCAVVQVPDRLGHRGVVLRARRHAVRPRAPADRLHSV